MTTFSFRAECRIDTEEFVRQCFKAGVPVQPQITPDSTGLPDCEVEFRSDASLEQLREIIRHVVDGHVMLQTLRPCPLADNSLERDYDLD